MKQDPLLIRGGMVVDGSGSPGRPADIRVENGRITQIQPDLPPQNGERIISADGLIVCPGFIDAHCHSDMYALDVPGACGKVMQGVTSDVCGLCGDSPAPIGSGSLEEFRRRREYRLPGGRELEETSFAHYVEQINRLGTAANMALFVGNSNLWIHTVGYHNRRASAKELDTMGRMLAESMEAGAFGLSTGLTYFPSQCASQEELIAVCRYMAPYGGIYNSHMRNEGDHILKAIQEVIAIAAHSGCRGHISHLKISGKRNHGKADACLELIHQARRQGIDITFDVYPYTAGSCGLRTLLPPEILEGGFDAAYLLSPDTLRRCRARLQDTDWDNILQTCGADSVVVVSGPQEVEGKSIAEITEQWDTDPAQAISRILSSTGGQGSIVYHALCDNDLETFLKDPLCSIGTDAFARNYTGPTAQGKPHPRNYGAFPRWIGQYVRQKHLFTLEEAIQKATSVPAGQFGLSHRGKLRIGDPADITVFDFQTIGERGTFMHPNRPPEGIRYVIVGGVCTVDGGTYREVRAGQVLTPEGSNTAGAE